MTRGRYATIAMTILGVLILAGCATAVPTATEPPAAPGPIATTTAPPPAGAEAPRRLDIACNDLGSPGALAGVLASPVTSQNPARIALAAFSGMPYSYFVEQAGGIECLWSDGAPASSVTGGGSSASASIAVLPDAAAGWAQYQREYGITSDMDVNCRINDGDGCQFDALVGTSWIEANIGRLSTAPISDTVASSAAATYFAHVSAVVRDAHSLPPAPHPATSVGCDRLISPSDFAALLGVSGPLSFGYPGGGDSIEFTGAAQVGETRCLVNLAGSDDGVGLVDVLPGAAWAARELRPLAILPSTPTNVTVTGLAAGEFSTIRYNAGTGEAVLDFTLRGDWVEVMLYPSSEGGVTVSGDVRAKLATVAAKIVDNLTAD